MRVRLLWKILLLNVPVLATGMLVIWLAIDYLAADYFMTLMEKHDVAPTTAHQMFVDSVHRYLIGASVAAMIIAGVVSFLLTRKILGPLTRITGTINAMASGSLTARVTSSSNDELGDLARAFNQMADNIRRLEDLRYNMLIDVAHELRTPLTNISGYLEGIRDGVVEPEEKTLALMQKEVSRLATLVEDVLDLARADAADVDLEKHEIALEDVIKDSIARHEREFMTKSLEVDLRIDDEVDIVRADREKLLWIFANLLENARQYAPAGSRVGISAYRQAGEIKISVSNTSEGIACKDLSLIFERFYRGEKSRSRKEGGAGIGLAIVKKLVEAHGGRVGAERENDITTVWFALPA